MQKQPDPAGASFDRRTGEDFTPLGRMLSWAKECRGDPAERPGDKGEQGESGRDAKHAGRALVLVWPDVVGPEVAANAHPVQLRNGRLVVSASSSVWAQTLQLMSEAIVERLNEHLGPDCIERLVCRHAGWENRSEERSGRENGLRQEEEVPRAGPPASGGGASQGRSGGTAAGPVEECLTAEQKKALADVERLDLAPDLREKIARAMKAGFVRAEQDSVR